jgi:hypothetical protein
MTELFHTGRCLYLLSALLGFWLFAISHIIISIMVFFTRSPLASFKSWQRYSSLFDFSQPGTKMTNFRGTRFISSSLPSRSKKGTIVPHMVPTDIIFTNMYHRDKVDMPSETKTPAEIGEALRKGAPSKTNDQLFYATTKDARDANHLAKQGGSVIASMTQEITSNEWVRFAAPAARLPPLTRALQKHLSEGNKNLVLERKMGALQKEMEQMAGSVADLKGANQALEGSVAGLEGASQALSLT